jgi:hypothetical protein
VLQVISRLYQHGPTNSSTAIQAWPSSNPPALRVRLP